MDPDSAANVRSLLIIGQSLDEHDTAVQQSLITALGHRDLSGQRSDRNPTRAERLLKAT